MRVELPEVYQPLWSDYRYKIMYGGRSAARSWTIARCLLIRGTQEPIRVLCTRELQKSIKQSVLRLLRDQIELLGLDGFYDTTDTNVKGANGTEFIFTGIRHNTQEIKSTEGIDICWVEEGENMTQQSWDILSPTIRKPGSEIWVSMNTRFRSDYIFQLFVENDPPPSSWVIKTTYADNPYFPEVLRIDMEHMKRTDYEQYLHIWEGELKQLAEGAIYGKQITKAKKEGRILDFPITNAPIDTFWDLGKNNQTAIWFMQKVGLQYRLVDYYESRLEEIPHYCDVLFGRAEVTDNSIRVRCPIRKADNDRRAGYRYGTHHMPHDISQDVLGMAKTRKQQFEEGGLKNIKRVNQTKSVNESIERVRDLFPQLYFHKTYCAPGIECLSNYRYKYNDETDSYHQQPFDDWATHGADALRQMADGYLDDTDKQDYRGAPGTRRSW